MRPVVRPQRVTQWLPSGQDRFAIRKRGRRTRVPSSAFHLSHRQRCAGCPDLGLPRARSCLLTPVSLGGDFELVQVGDPPRLLEPRFLAKVCPEDRQRGVSRDCIGGPSRTRTLDPLMVDQLFVANPVLEPGCSRFSRGERSTFRPGPPRYAQKMAAGRSRWEAVHRRESFFNRATRTDRRHFLTEDPLRIHPRRT
jgi:hypothetical protein